MLQALLLIQSMGMTCRDSTFKASRLTQFISLSNPMSQVAVWRGHPRGVLGYWHHGILCPNNTVIHFKSEIPKSKRTACVVRTSLSEFKGKSSEVYIVLQPPNLVFTPSQVEGRAISKLGASNYHILFNNCESFARWCLTGHSSSRQVNSYLLGSIAGIPGLLVSAFKLSFSDCYAGRMVQISMSS